MRSTFLAMTMLGLLTGCAMGGPPPSASARPWDPNLLTESRQTAANRWATDIDNRRFVEPYMNAICAQDGPWAKRNAAWRLAQADYWANVLWRFEPIPNAPSGGGAVDWSKLVEVLVGVGMKAIDVALVAPPRTALPSGLPPC